MRSRSFSSQVGIQELFLVCDTLSMPSGAQDKSGTHHPRSGSGEKQGVPRLNLTGLYAVGKRNGYGCCRAVAVLSDNVDGSFRRNSRSFPVSSMMRVLAW